MTKMPLLNSTYFPRAMTKHIYHKIIILQYAVMLFIVPEVLQSCRGFFAEILIKIVVKFIFPTKVISKTSFLGVT